MLARAVSPNNLGNDGALVFVNALRGNSKLRGLGLIGNGINNDGWEAFSSLLCDTSSVNNTFLSNHTLEGFDNMDRYLPADLVSSLELNASSENKGQIAMTKVLQHHSHFNVQSFFEWEFKVLPLVIAWLEKANTRTFFHCSLRRKIKGIKLSCMYEFVREFPMLCIEPITRKEIEEFSAMELQLQEDQMQLTQQLEQIQRNKARATRRLL